MLSVFIIFNRDWNSPKYFGGIFSSRNLIKMPLKKFRQCSQPLMSSYMSRSWVCIQRLYKWSANSGQLAFLTSGIEALQLTYIHDYYWNIKSGFPKMLAFWNFCGHGFNESYGVNPQLRETSSWWKFLRVSISYNMSS